MVDIDVVIFNNMYFSIMDGRFDWNRYFVLINFVLSDY